MYIYCVGYLYNFKSTHLFFNLLFPRLISKLYAKEDSLRNDIINKTEESARALRVKDEECFHKTLSTSQYAAIVDTITAYDDTLVSKSVMDMYRYTKNQQI